MRIFLNRSEQQFRNLTYQTSTFKVSLEVQTYLDRRRNTLLVASRFSKIRRPKVFRSHFFIFDFEKKICTLIYLVVDENFNCK